MKVYLSTNGRHSSKNKTGPRNILHTRYEDQPPAVTRPGEQWALNGFNMSNVIIVRDGPDAHGKNYVDGRHQVTVARFETVRDAAAAVQAFNALNEIIAAYEAGGQQFALDVREILKNHGRVGEISDLKPTLDPAPQQSLRGDE